jgi:hypothetical protein
VDKTPNRDQGHPLRQRTLELFQLFLLVFAFYVPLQDRSNEHLLVSLACLVAVFVVGKLKAPFAGALQKEGQGHDRSPKDGTKTAVQALDWLLKSKNVLLLTDAIQWLLQDLGVVVSPCPHHPAVDRLIRVPGGKVAWGLKILSDIGALDHHWDQWEALASFEREKGGKRRLLIIASNGLGPNKEGRQRYRNFPAHVQDLLSAKHAVAMTTLTLGKIYLLCKKKNRDMRTLLDPMENHPGGVFQVKHPAK